MRRPLGSCAGLLLALMALSCGEGCGRSASDVPHLTTDPSLRGSGEERLRASSLALDKGVTSVAMAFRSHDGVVAYIGGDSERSRAEPVVDQASEGPVALAHDATGDPVVAVVVREHHLPSPPVSALVDSSVGISAEEGDLLVLHRRSPDVWRKRAVAARALLPSIAVGAEGEVHLAFLQPTCERSFSVVYVRLHAGKVLREDVGSGALKVTPHITLSLDSPIVSYLAEGEYGPVVRQFQASDGVAFRPVREISSSLLGKPEAIPSLLVWTGDLQEGCLMVSRPLEQSHLVVEARRHRLDPRARQAIVRWCVGPDGREEASAIATKMDGRGGWFEPETKDDLARARELVSLVGSSLLEDAPASRSEGIPDLLVWVYE